MLTIANNDYMLQFAGMVQADPDAGSTNGRVDGRDPLECPCDIRLPRMQVRSGLAVFGSIPFLLLCLWGAVMLLRSCGMVGFDPGKVDWRGTGSMLSGLAAVTTASLGAFGAIKALQANPKVQSDVSDLQPTGDIQLFKEIEEQTS
jgi:hypothetical protein